ncbi:unnamed protein product [Heterobilharzia americana]|nr:unnamed protein product [Heterobilharzia americana]
MESRIGEGKHPTSPSEARRQQKNLKFVIVLKVKEIWRTGSEYVEKLNKLGLKDPWIRNYAWVYSSRVYRTRSQHLKLMFLSQLPVGIVLGVVASLMVNAFDRWRKRQFQLASH